jgi:hypothetical protein
MRRLHSLLNFFGYNGEDESDNNFLQDLGASVPASTGKEHVLSGIRGKRKGEQLIKN